MLVVMNKLNIRKESLPLHTPFGISRSRVNAVEVIVVEIEDESGLKGWGECRPYARYDETPESVTRQIESVLDSVEAGVSRRELMNLLPAGAARFAVDSALWDLEAKQKQTSVWDTFLNEGGTAPALPTMQTIGLDTPEVMAEESLKIPKGQVIKIKLGGDSVDSERIEAIHAIRPDAKLVVDANEGFDIETFKAFLSKLPKGSVHMIEQPLPSQQDSDLKGLDTKGVLLCGDESIHTAEDIVAKQDIYDVMNIKLDKSGGLTHGMDMLQTIQEINKTRKQPLQTMVGCMVSSSLSIQPAFLLSQFVEYVDLDGPWWLKEDRAGGVSYFHGKMSSGTLWGEPL